MEHEVKEQEGKLQCWEECGACYNRFSVAVFVPLVFWWTYSWGEGRNAPKLLVASACSHSSLRGKVLV